jgi:hypothetical protein
MLRFASVWIAVAALWIVGCGHGAERGPSTAAETITAAEMQSFITYLASDAMQGRNTPSPQLDTAAAYIARVFSRHGARPVDGKFTQTVKLNIIALAEPNILRIQKDGNEVTYEIKTDFVPFDMTATGEVHGQVVFAGYGITAPEYKYDDYASLDAKGKIVLVLRHEPGEEDTASVFKGKEATEYSNVATKVRIAREHGAIGVLVVNDPLNHTSMTPRGFPWPSLSKTIPRDALPMVLGGDENEKVPVVQVGESVVNQLLGSVDALREIQARIDSARMPRSFAIAGAEVRLQTSMTITELAANNVVGVIEGSDPVLRNEVVIVGAHYDHVGVKKNTPAGEDSVYNGADDNASGTCALLGVAEAFGALPQKPMRTVLLIAFAGEEKGLFGSEYYVRHPLFPLKQTVAMINLDMVGRNSVDSLYLVGSESSPDLARIVREENSRVGFVLTDLDMNYGGSDHMSFQKRSIPSIFLHSGVHKDLHQVSDNPEFINTAKIAKASQLAFLAAYRLANDSQHYQHIPHTISLF